MFTLNSFKQYILCMLFDKHDKLKDGYNTFYYTLNNLK